MMIKTTTHRSPLVTIPFGISSFRIALWPFGRTVVRRPDAGVASAVGNLVWLVFAGIWPALGHIITEALLCITEPRSC